MLEHRVRVQIVPWDDVAFRLAAEGALDSVRAEGTDIDSERAAGLIQARLRRAGYPEATVEAHRTVDEALAHVTHFEVRRD